MCSFRTIELKGAGLCGNAMRSRGRSHFPAESSVGVVKSELLGFNSAYQSRNTAKPQTRFDSCHRSARTPRRCS